MDQDEIVRRGRDLGKAVASNEASSTLLGMLEELRKGFKATEEILRSTKIGITVNKLRQHKDPKVAQNAADLVAEWRVQVKKRSGSGGSAGGSGATPTGAGSSASGKASPARNGNGTTESANGKDKDPTTGGPTDTGVASSPPATWKSSVPLEQRNTKTDNVTLPDAGTAVRDSCLKLMYDGLAHNSEEAPDTIIPIAVAVEHAANESLQADAYKTKMRSLYQNLKNKSNPQLRINVLNGIISPERLVSMSAEDLKSPERRAEDMRMEKENMNNAMVAQAEQSISASLTCSKCHQKKVSYSQAQTRSADEPMTTFCECTVCGNRWKFS